MDQDAGEIAVQQAAILTACNQPPFTTFQWPVGFQTWQDTAAKKEICYTISKFWSMHSYRMQTNAEAWEVSRQVAGYKINSHADDLNGAMEKFINFMTNLTLESLKL